MEDWASFVNTESSDEAEISKFLTVVSITLIPKLEKYTTVKRNYGSYTGLQDYYVLRSSPSWLWHYLET